ncbi:MAG: hypothetical protein ACI8WB_000329 [Phenylobacterium sp.]|jgi:hypothetical protein
MPQGRAISLLSRSVELDVLWTATTVAREKALLPVRIPLLKGLLGYRVFIIRAGDQAKFAAINTLEQLQALTAGQGHDWPDTQILRANFVKVETTSTYDGLFAMLKAKRFDYFPRGVNEAWAELASHQDKAFMVEKSLLIHYPLPTYFFVAPGNTALANRLEQGLRMAQQDGSFEQLFYAYLNSDDGVKLDGLKDRKMIKLVNPFLPVLTPVDEKDLWY